MKRIVFASALALVTAAPCWAQSAEEDYRAGVAARHAGNPAEAVERLRRTLASEPDNADAHLQLGLAFLALGRLDEAESSLRRTLEIAPDYADARIGLARLYQRRGHADAALAELDRVSRPNDEADELAARLRSAAAAPTPFRWRLDLDGSYAALENGEDWQGLDIALRHQATPATTIGVALEGARRFDRTDVYGEARMDHRLTDGASVYVLLGGTPDADFRPEWQVGAGGALRVTEGGSATVLRLDARHAEYRAGDVQTLTPGVEQYLLGGRAWLTGQWINVFDGQTGRHRMGWLGRGDVLATETLRLFAGAADAPDLSEGVVIPTVSLFGGASWDATERATFRLSLAHEDRATGRDRSTVSLGVGLRF
jgi:YaiO family outer membrane protein